MMGNRKKLLAELSGIKRIEELYEYRKSVFIDNSTAAEYEEMLVYIETVISKLKRKINKAPIGYQYTGTFYIRKINMDQTVERIEMSGTAFMREDIVSWKIDSDHEYSKNLYHVREIFKDPACKETISREECEPVFENNN